MNKYLYPITVHSYLSLMFQQYKLDIISNQQLQVNINACNYTVQQHYIISTMQMPYRKALLLISLMGICLFDIIRHYYVYTRCQCAMHTVYLYALEASLSTLQYISILSQHNNGIIFYTGLNVRLITINSQHSPDATMCKYSKTLT